MQYYSHVMPIDTLPPQGGLETPPEAERDPGLDLFLMQQLLREEYAQQLAEHPEAEQELEQATDVDEAMAVIREWFIEGPQQSDGGLGIPPLPPEVLSDSPENEGNFRLERALHLGSADLAIARLTADLNELADQGGDRAAQVRSQLSSVLTSIVSAFSASGVSPGSVHLFDAEGGVLGHNTVGDGDQNIGIAITAILNHSDRPGLLFLILREVLIHESRHGRQVHQQMGDGAAALVLGHERVVDNDEVRLLEADTEYETLMRGVREIESKPAEYDPTLAQAAIAITSEADWDQMLLSDGDVAAFQERIWLERLEDGTLTLRELAREEELTQYHAEAQRVREAFARRIVEAMPSAN